MKSATEIKSTVTLRNPTIVFTKDAVIKLWGEANPAKAKPNTVNATKSEYIIPSMSDFYSTLRVKFGKGLVTDKQNKLKLKGLYRLYLDNTRQPFKMTRLVKKQTHDSTE